MEEKYIIEKIEFAIKYAKKVMITSVRNKTFSAFIFGTKGNIVYWSNNESIDEGLKPMNINNINNIKFETCEDNEFSEYLKCRKYSIEDFKEICMKIDNIFEYYKQILNCEIDDIKKEKKEKDRNKEIKALEGKIKFIDSVHKNIYESEDDLLFPFITQAKINNKNNAGDNLPILLLNNSNASQKQAIEKALQNKISFIEGPPGTGKTTTIISIVANLLYRNKKVVVVSKNNSAIDNIAEEFDKLDLPPIYVRLGNNDYLDKLFESIIERIINYQENIQEVDFNDNTYKLTLKYQQLKQKETLLNEIVKKKNELDELSNQLRHIEKKKDAFDEPFLGEIPFWIKLLQPDKLCGIINKISMKIQKYNIDNDTWKGERKLSIFDAVVAYIFWRIKPKEYFKQYLLLKWEIETIYNEQKTNEMQKQIVEANFENTKEEISDIYESYYKEESLRLLKASLYKYHHCENSCFEKLIEQINEFKTKYESSSEREEENSGYLKERSHIIDLITDFFPFVLTTADALPNNFYKYRFGKDKFDYIIMDESTQCDVISGISTLFYAKKCVISGDSKQLSAITKDYSELIDVPAIPDNLKNNNNNFLNATKLSFGVEPTLLKEHYRCDYNIINYCNHFFYNDELIIYNEPAKDSMQLLNVGFGKYVCGSEGSFENEREIYSIDAQCKGDLSKAYVITPFKGQKEALWERFNSFKANCGTIHSFQGRGKEIVYFSTVLNDLDACNRHLNGSHNLFTPELINVAVSRAKEKFVLVTDKEYFLGKSKLIRDLIRYIEKYGEEIPDKTVCLFDYLYKQMSTYTPKENCSNIFEFKIWETLNEFAHNNSYLAFVKLPLAELITDREYLNAHVEIKEFIMNDLTHVDFVLENNLGNPVLAIELDGEHHNKLEQIERDRKKDAALKHMNIPIMRVNSKAAFSKGEFMERVKAMLV